MKHELNIPIEYFHELIHNVKLIHKCEVCSGYLEELAEWADKEMKRAGWK